MTITQEKRAEYETLLSYLDRATGTSLCRESAVAIRELMAVSGSYAAGRAAGLEEERHRFEASGVSGRLYRSTEPGYTEEYCDPHTQMAWRAWQARAALSPTPSEAGKDDDKWYLQDTRCYVGNDVMWWAKDGNGYTTDVSKAHVYERDAAFRQAAMRGTDRAWPKAYIDRKTRPAVDMQYINHDEALSSLEVIGKGEKG